MRRRAGPELPGEPRLPPPRAAVGAALPSAPQGAFQPGLALGAVQAGHTTPARWLLCGQHLRPRQGMLGYELSLFFFKKKKEFFLKKKTKTQT